METNISPKLDASQLNQLSCDLANEIQHLSKIVGGYELEYREAQRLYKREVAKMTMVKRADGVPTQLARAAALNCKEVMDAESEIARLEALYINGKAELQGRVAQYQGVKKMLDLEIEYIRAGIISEYATGGH